MLKAFRNGKEITINDFGVRMGYGEMENYCQFSHVIESEGFGEVHTDSLEDGMCEIYLMEV